MTTDVDRLAARAAEADRRQAAYYRMMLTRQRAAIEGQLANDHTGLATQLNAGDPGKIKRLQRGIRRKQTEANTLDRLIAALDQRLGTRGQA
jgi:hypothetical protein